MRNIKIIVFFLRSIMHLLSAKLEYVDVKLINTTQFLCQANKWI